MKWNQFLGGILVGAALGIMVGVAVAPGSGPESVSTSTAGFCTLLAIAGMAAAGIGREMRRSRLPGTANEPASDARSARDDQTPPAR